MTSNANHTSAAQTVARLVIQRAREIEYTPDKFSNTFIHGCVLRCQMYGDGAPATAAAIAARPTADDVRAAIAALHPVSPESLKVTT